VEQRQLLFHLNISRDKYLPSALVELPVHIGIQVIQPEVRVEAANLP
jgi:hypothetical protein